MSRACLLLSLILAGAVAGCGWFARAPKPEAHPHYLLGDAYELGGRWYYPHASYDAVETGLAAVAPSGHAPLTADGEIYDPAALAAAHRTLQLPAIARVTNLENGRQIVVRIDDRGPADPGRLIALTPRAGALLGIDGGGGAGGGAQVRLEVLGPESHAVADPLGAAAAARLPIAAAPRGSVTEAALPPPPGIGQQPRAADGLPTSPVDDPAEPALPSVPDRLPETVVQTAPEPGALYVQLGTFGRRGFAERQAARVAGLGPAITREQTGRSETYHVAIGPLAGVAAADRALAGAIEAGIPDARIVVE